MSHSIKGVRGDGKMYVDDAVLEGDVCVESVEVFHKSVSSLIVRGFARKSTFFLVTGCRVQGGKLFADGLEDGGSVFTYQP